MNLSARGGGWSPLLLVLCGPSHAGKTTFANRLCRSGLRFTVISPDNIRKRLCVGFCDPEQETRVWDIYESMKVKALSEGRNVILDACHMSNRARRHGLQGQNASYRKICVVFDLPLRTVRHRCIKDKRVPLREVERMWRAFQKSKPTVKGLKAEGFDEVYFVTEHVAYGGEGLWMGVAASTKKEPTLVGSQVLARPTCLQPSPSAQPSSVRFLQLFASLWSAITSVFSRAHSFCLSVFDRLIQWVQKADVSLCCVRIRGDCYVTKRCLADRED
jgi:predicted kinase